MRYQAPSWAWGALIASALGVRDAAAQLPDGPGKDETARLCSQCHAADVATSIRQDRAGWTATLRKMAGLGAKGTPEEFSAALEYLVLHFRADELPRININTATAIDLESALTLRRSQARAIIAYRTEHGRFKSFDDLRNVPGLDLAALAAKIGRLVF